MARVCGNPSIQDYADSLAPLGIYTDPTGFVRFLPHKPRYLEPMFSLLFRSHGGKRIATRVQIGPDQEVKIVDRRFSEEDHRESYPLSGWFQDFNP